LRLAAEFAICVFGAGVSGRFRAGACLIAAGVSAERAQCWRWTGFAPSGWQVLSRGGLAGRGAVLLAIAVVVVISGGLCRRRASRHDLQQLTEAA